MSHDDSKKASLTDKELDGVAGGGNAIEQIQQAINETGKSPQSSTETMNWLPPDTTTPSSAPYNT